MPTLKEMAVDALREQLEEERAECERLRGMLSIAREGLGDAIRVGRSFGLFTSRLRWEDALRRSNPAASQEDAVNQ